MQLERLTGPECAKCGCADARVIGTGTRWGQPTTRRRCNHCGWTWSSNDPPPDHPVTPSPDHPQAAGAVEYSSVRCRCPVCRAINPKVQSTKAESAGGSRFRQHRCQSCGATFQSREKIEN